MFAPYDLVKQVNHENQNKEDLRDVLRTSLDLMFSQSSPVIQFRHWLLETCEGKLKDQLLSEAMKEYGLSRNEIPMIEEYLEVLIDQGYLYRDQFKQLHPVNPGLAS